jgi:acid stress chaperone HdeB
MKNSIILALSVVLLMGQIVHAQVTLDVAKITCKQMRGYEITNPNNIALWLSGFYHGKTGSTTLQVDEFKGIAEKVNDYCISHPTSTVMQAVESTAATKAK